MALEDPVPIKYEDLDSTAVAAIHRAFPGIQGMILGITEIDPACGAGVFKTGSKCVWTRDGRRITIWTSTDGGMGASCSKDRDPLSDPEAR